MKSFLQNNKKKDNGTALTATNIAIILTLYSLVSATFY